MDKKIRREVIRLAWMLFGLGIGVWGFLWLARLTSWSVSFAVMMIFWSYQIQFNNKKK